MKRARIIVKGRVQRVGYRDEVEEIARRLGIKGFVENIKPYDIRIVTEGEDEAISEFIERIKIKRFPIDVESVEVSFEDFKGEFEYFEIKRGNWQEELGERLDAAGKLLYKSIKLAERSVELAERSVELSEESVSIGKRMLEKQDETINEIKGLREDLKSYMEERFDRLEHEVMAIKTKLGMV
ncbi:MAG: acylphosphatase [Methanophagales archaeon]|nr:acylphosphatase [Methanophagales archaeon]